MDSAIVVSTSDEKDYCHFCFGAASRNLPLVRPDLLSFIDNIMGISITPEVCKSFRLCGECITTLDMFIKFRNQSRLHYGKMREVNIMNQAVKGILPIQLDGNEGAIPNESLVQSTSMNSSSQGDENEDYNQRAYKRKYTQLTYGIDPDSSTKKARIQNGTKRKPRFHHIREIMNRFRNNRLQINNGSATSPVSSKQNGIDFTNDQPLLNANTYNNYTVSCKPCMVVVKKISTHELDLSKS